MTSNKLLEDAFGRIHDVVHQVAKGLSKEDLAFQPKEKQANSIAWLIWHLTRIQDDHISELAGKEQIWIANGWHKKFGLPFEPSATGYGQNSREVSAVQPSTNLLLGYYDNVHAQTITYIHQLQRADYEKVIDESWDPPVTVAVRLISVIADDLQHAGQAAYVRGLL